MLKKVILELLADGKVLGRVAGALAAVDPGGGSTPTGTGFRHVVAGVEDAAAKLAENADVHASAAIALSKLANVSATDKLLGRSTAGAGPIEEVLCTAAGRAILDDVDAAAQRTTLGAAATSHSHAEADVTGLVSDLAAKEGTANKAAASGYASLDAGTKVPIAQVPTGSSSTTVCIGNDARLSDARTPLAHTHPLSEITDEGTMAAVNDAPSDGSIYGRLNGAWAVAGGGSGLTQPQVMARLSVGF